MYLGIAKRDLAHNLYYFIFLCPLQLLSYALEISLSIMELKWPEFRSCRGHKCLLEYEII